MIVQPAQQTVAGSRVVLPSINTVSGASISNKSSDSVTLETDDGFYNIKATGDPGSVTRVFQKLQDGMGGSKMAVVGNKAVTSTGGGATVAADAAAASAAKEAANEAKVKAKEQELEAKKKADAEKLENEKKAAK